MYLFPSSLGCATARSVLLLIWISVGALFTFEGEELECMWLGGIVSVLIKSVFELLVVLWLGANGKGFVHLRNWSWAIVSVGALKFFGKSLRFLGHLYAIMFFFLCICWMDGLFPKYSQYFFVLLHTTSCWFICGYYNYTLLILYWRVSWVPVESPFGVFLLWLQPFHGVGLNILFSGSVHLGWPGVYHSLLFCYIFSWFSKTGCRGCFLCIS